MSTVRARHRMVAVVEPSEEALDSVQLEHVSAGTGALTGELTPAPPAGQNRFRPGDVLFSKLRPYLAKSLLVTSDIQGSGEFLCLRSGPDMEPRFLMYLTLSQLWIDHAILTSYGTKMPRTSWEAMADLALPDIPLAEQRRVADFLDDRVARIDQIITARRQQSALLIENFRARLEARLRPFPSVPVRHLAREILVGIVIQPSKLYTDEVDGIPALRGLNVREGRIVREDLVRITLDGHRANPRSRLRAGDVVVVRTGDAGSAAVVPDHCDDWNCIDLVIVRPASTVSAQYLELALNSAKHQASISAAASGAMQQHFGVNALGALTIPYPEVNAEGVAKELSLLREEATFRQQQLSESIARLAEYKQSLIAAAVTGELDVTTAGSGVPG